MNRGVVRRGGLAVAAVLAVITLGAGLVMALGRPAGVPPNHATGVPAATLTTVSPERAVQIVPDGTAAINPTTPIVVRAMVGTLQSVTVVNAASGTVVRGEGSPDHDLDLDRTARLRLDLPDRCDGGRRPRCAGAAD